MLQDIFLDIIFADVVLCPAHPKKEPCAITGSALSRAAWLGSRCWGSTTIESSSGPSLDGSAEMIPTHGEFAQRCSARWLEPLRLKVGFWPRYVARPSSVRVLISSARSLMAGKSTCERLPS